MTTLETPSDGPVVDLFLAINHYISTGDHVGEGVAMEGTEGDYLFAVAWDPKNPTDTADLAKLRARLTEITKDGQIPLRIDDLPKPIGEKFQHILLHVRPADIRLLAQALLRRPSPLGWGSFKPEIDRHFPDVRAKILSGEGV